MKFKKEWPKLVQMGKAKDLTQEQLYFLLALREQEGGQEGNEFNVKAVKGTSFEEQAAWAIGSILKNDRRWQDYIREQSYLDFPTFFRYLGGPYGNGWHYSHPGSAWVVELKNIMKEVENGFKTDTTVG